MIQLFQRFSNKKCCQCERCFILYSYEFTALSKELRLKVLRDFYATKSEEFCMSNEEYRKLQADIWEAYKYQILMRDIKVKVELDKKLLLVKRFNESFTEDDIKNNTTKYLKALKDIENLFSREFHKPQDAIKVPKWRLIIQNTFDKEY